MSGRDAVFTIKILEQNFTEIIHKWLLSTLFRKDAHIEACIDDYSVIVATSDSIYGLMQYSFTSFA